MSYRYVLFLILGVDISMLFFQTTSLSISHYEALILYGDLSFLQILIKTSIAIFGANDFALRFPMIILHLSSTILLYMISADYLREQRNRIWLVLIFVLLPGVISSAIIVDSAGLIIFGLLLFIYMYKNFAQKYIYILLALYTIIDGGFVYLFLSLAIFSIYIKQGRFFLFNMSLFFISLYLFGIESGGAPKGHFLDAMAVYSAIFSPIIFIYIFYTLYRKYLTKDLDILWFIASVAFVLSLFLSFRQRVELEHLAPYLIMALPLAAQTFYHSYRVRLKIFRTKYKLIFTISLILLILNFLVVFFNKELYRFMSDPTNHFAYKMHVAKELASALKLKDITCVSTDKKMSNRLKFYGISKCSKYILLQTSLSPHKKRNVTISYKETSVYSANVTEINTD